MRGGYPSARASQGIAPLCHVHSLDGSVSLHVPVGDGNGNDVAINALLLPCGSLGEVNCPSPRMGEGLGGVEPALPPPIPAFPHAGGRGLKVAIPSPVSSRTGGGMALSTSRAAPSSPCREPPETSRSCRRRGVRRSVSRRRRRTSDRWPQGLVHRLKGTASHP
jgi:hypothetical protein